MSAHRFHWSSPFLRLPSRRRDSAEPPPRQTARMGFCLSCCELVSFASEKRRHVEPLRGSTPPAINGCGLRPVNIVGSVRPAKVSHGLFLRSGCHTVESKKSQTLNEVNISRA